MLQRIRHIGPEEEKMFLSIIKKLRGNRQAASEVLGCMLQYCQVRHMYERCQFWDPTLVPDADPMWHRRGRALGRSGGRLAVARAAAAHRLTCRSRDERGAVRSHRALRRDGQVASGGLLRRPQLGVRREASFGEAVDHEAGNGTAGKRHS